MITYKRKETIVYFLTLPGHGAKSCILHANIKIHKFTIHKPIFNEKKNSYKKQEQQRKTLAVKSTKQPDGFSERQHNAQK